MKLVLAYAAGDGYTWWANVRLPIEYESAEAAAVDFEKLCKDALDAYKSNWASIDFAFCQHKFCASDFFIDGKYSAPDFWTIDEWFQHESA